MIKKWQLFLLSSLVLALLLSGCSIFRPEASRAPAAGRSAKPEASFSTSEKKKKKEGAESMAENYEAYFSISKITDEIFMRMQGNSYPKDCPLDLETLRYVTVAYINFDGEPCSGELVVNAEIAEDVISVFKELFKEKYPIERICLIDDYGADDDKSMAANNSSAFCYRVISGTDKLSNHSYGLAVDINPLYNPYIKSNGQVLPAEAEAFADRTLSNPYYITPEDTCVRIFKKYGFTWGGDWNSSKDYQHFEREL